MSDFGLQAHLEMLYQDPPRRLAFRATTLDEYKDWQTSLRGEVVQLLGRAGRTPPLKPQAELMQVIDRGDYSEEKYALDLGEGISAPMYMLQPKADPPHKAILAFHGHGPGVQLILGNYPDETTRNERVAMDDNFAQALAQAGYLVCALEQRGFGERTSDQINPDKENACRHLAFEYMMQGRVLLGERCWDGMVAISYLQNRPDLLPGFLGCTGHSGGGTTALWLAAIDARITSVVVSGYFCSFKRSILGMQHCECNYVPGILPLAEMGDLAALVAPRPFRVIAGETDPIFPVDGVRQQFGTLQRAYALWNAAEQVSLRVHPGGHAYNHELAKEWFGAN